ncbi:hypothetical protein [Trueperella abortisuis]|uniref:Uncharacterized protein n=1 Tax=Trueperella abortisuis TaxID=445930 RepID=A0ABT9PHW0_9ACTO|nr:hypothetical protein [Trueperella abortisuis]MDP9832067.1 hypothetical protein [Trueperella abortisuis]
MVIIESFHQILIHKPFDTLMADTQHTDTTEATDEAETSQAPGTDSAPAQETDWKAEARKWEDRAKANRAQVSQLKTRITELEGASGDLEKVLARIGALEKHNADLEFMWKDEDFQADIIDRDMAPAKNTTLSRALTLASTTGSTRSRITRSAPGLST